VAASGGDRQSSLRLQLASNVAQVERRIRYPTHRGWERWRKNWQRRAAIEMGTNSQQMISRKHDRTGTLGAATRGSNNSATVAGTNAATSVASASSTATAATTASTATPTAAPVPAAAGTASSTDITTAPTAPTARIAASAIGTSTGTSTGTASGTASGATAAAQIAVPTPRRHQQNPHLVRVRLRHDDRMPRPCGMGGGKQHPRYGFQLAAQSKLAVKLDLTRVMALRRMQFDLLRSQQNPQCDRQIEPATALGYVGRRQIDGDSSRREFKVGIDEGRANAVPAFLNDCGRQSNNTECGQAGPEAHLNLYERRMQTQLRAAGYDRDRHSLPWLSFVLSARFLDYARQDRPCSGCLCRQLPEIPLRTSMTLRSAVYLQDYIHLEV
jgi:hypothetical protein